MSPAARKRARELGLDPAALVAGAVGGVIDVAAVERAGTRAAEPAPGPAAPVDKNQRMREAIANAMARSKREIPHYYLGTDIDLGAALGWLERRNAGRPVTERLLPGVLFIRAVALALRQVSELNARWENGGARPMPRINVGVAIALRGGGLVAPAILDTDTLELDALMARFKDLVQRARTGMLRASELSEPTITVTSLGERGVETVFPVIYPPQVAIVGFGKVVDRPWVSDGQLCVRPVVKATLAADHRVSDGHRGALFLAAVAEQIQKLEAS